jgi:anti-sigma regulatory factor (Ser/Thr protein kinase)
LSVKEKPLVLLIPALPEFVGTARLFVAEVARHFGIGEGVVADVKIAISEACTGAITSQPKGSETGIRIEAHPSSPGLRFSVTSTGAWAPSGNEEWDPATPTDSFQKVLGIGLVEGLFPDARFEATPEGASLTFSVTTGETQG